MHYNIFFVGMDVHKGTFKLRCYDMKPGENSTNRRLEANYKHAVPFISASI